MPNSEVYQPLSERICGSVCTSAWYSQPWCANPIRPLLCGYLPEKSDPREGEHSGAVACASVNRMPSAASRSRWGLLTPATP